MTAPTAAPLLPAELLALPGAVAAFDDGGRLHWGNPALWRLLDEPAPAGSGPLPRARLAELFTPAARLVYQTGVLPVLLATGRVDEAYLTLRGAPGAQVPVVANFCRWRPAGAADPGTLNLVVLVQLRDRKRLDAALLRARRTSEQVPGVLCQLLLPADGRPRVPWSNEALALLLDVSLEAMQQDARLLLHRVLAADRPALQASLRQSAADMAPWHHTFRVRVRGRVHWLQGRATPQALAEGGMVWHAYLEDVTEHRQLQQRLLDQEVAARAAQAKTLFLARVSHELRTPLNAVLGFTRLLEADPTLALSPIQRRHLNQIAHAGHALLALVNDLLDLHRLDSGGEVLAPQVCGLEALVADACQLVEPLLRGAHLTLHQSVPMGLQVWADPRRLSQCLLNLLSNAIKYNRAGGLVQVQALSQAGEVGLAVRDTGHGLSEAQREHLFEAFNRLGAEQQGQEGTGLGLVITRSLMQRMGGRIEVQSQLGLGSCVTLWLPAAPPPPPQGGAAPGSPVFEGPGQARVVGQAAGQDAPAAAPLPSLPLVLYVDDGPLNLVLIQAVAAQASAWRLACAADGAEALALAAQEPPHLLLLDLSLPDMDGATLLRQLRALPGLAQVPAVAVSAHDRTHAQALGLAQPFDHYWTKPLDLARVRQALDGWQAGAGLPDELGWSPPPRA
ncbi:hybrid sensor histidine kinase/response regulator [Ideonella livida]|uniref:histidine kinase n=1 Tax=Ideonella livida TaxID=2707176 RepID=A0A7C9PJN8_9BURK|nr:hybrid sensor histidine kinase/response regulator [Ideonella livida]NDY92911.1 HAMP domain-containing histidine kinase [Ideonella livida]